MPKRHNCARFIPEKIVFFLILSFMPLENFDQGKPTKEHQNKIRIIKNPFLEVFLVSFIFSKVDLQLSQGCSFMQSDIGAPYLRSPCDDARSS
jgi:hypothetical protein